MSQEDGLPQFTGPVDTLQYGFSNLEASKVAPHPIQGLERRAGQTEFNEKMDRIKRSYGIHMAMRLATEEVIYGRERRLPGLPSSRALYDTITGNGTRIDFKDFLDTPHISTGPTVSFHKQTEIQHGLV